jgi:hypothetical protein
MAALAAILALAAPRAGIAQQHGALPFGVGERLTYTARVAKVGTVGKALMWVEGPAEVRGRSTYVLRFDFNARVGPVKAADRTESWLDARQMTALRFHKYERHPLSKHSEQVELFPGERRWRADEGESGESPTSAPLDELSFMYFIRTLALPADTVYRFDRHFDAARNPTTVRVVKRETLTTGAGEFRTVLLEMRVKDPRRYRGEGVIRISLSDDDRRLPVRIESAMPVIGTAVLTLDSYTRPVPLPLAARF